MTPLRRSPVLALHLATLLGCLLATSSTASAVPRMSLTAGTPCSACHINGQGGGQRTEIGWGTGLFTGAYVPEKFEELESNAFFDDLISVGADVRFQSFRGAPAVGSDELPARRVIPMQIQPYLAAYATDWLTLYGSYNLGPSVFQGAGLCDPVYAGQSCYIAAAKIRPSPLAPSVRLGNIQPSIGIRHDDHTMFIRGDVANLRAPVIAPNYAELGAEMSYVPAHWFQTDAGVFRAANIAEAIGDEQVVSPNDVAYLGRVQLMPRWDERDLVSWIGTSLYGAGSWHMENYFVGIGKLDTAALMFEVSRGDRGQESAYRTLNFSAEVDVTFREWLVLSTRVERGTTTDRGELLEAQQAVIGLEFFPVPFVEIRPEYRYTRTDSYQIGQHTLQLHFFY